MSKPVFIGEEVLISPSVTDKVGYLHPAGGGLRLDSSRTSRPQRLAFGQSVWTELSERDCFKGCSVGDTTPQLNASALRGFHVFAARTPSRPLLVFR